MGPVGQLLEVAVTRTREITAMRSCEHSVRRRRGGLRQTPRQGRRHRVRGQRMKMGSLELRRWVLTSFIDRIAFSQMLLLEKYLLTLNFESV